VTVPFHEFGGDLVRLAISPAPLGPGVVAPLRATAHEIVFPGSPAGDPVLKPVLIAILRWGGENAPA
jgi:hypothetical protein